jgi:hypothetical protein
LSRIPVKPETAIIGCCSLLRQREAPCEIVVEPTPPTGHVRWDNNVVKNFKAHAEIAELLKHDNDYTELVQNCWVMYESVSETAKAMQRIESRLSCLHKQQPLPQRWTEAEYNCKPSAEGAARRK